MPPCPTAERTEPTWPGLASLLAKPENPSRMNTYAKRAANPSRMRTYKIIELKVPYNQHLQKIGGGGGGPYCYPAQNGKRKKPSV